MNETDPPKAETRDGRVTDKEREENARKAREAADRLFPEHEWIKVEDRIYLSSNRAIGSKSNYEGELRNAQILRDFGSTVYLAPEKRDTPGRKYDAIVNGLIFEFKNVGGNANTLVTHFLKSRTQAPNVFMNLENSQLTRHEVRAALYGARNSKTHTTAKGNTIKGYDDINRFDGGRIVLKLKGQKHLVYLDVDNI